jgi:hypothetical protein
LGIALSDPANGTTSPTGKADVLGGSSGGGGPEPSSPVAIRKLTTAYEGFAGAVVSVCAGENSLAGTFCGALGAVRTVWAPFAEDTDYWPAAKQGMVNFTVGDLDAMLAQLRDAGAEVDEKVEIMDGIGRFGWAFDPEGNRFELWEPDPALLGQLADTRTYGDSGVIVQAYRSKCD